VLDIRDTGVKGVISVTGILEIADWESALTDNGYSIVVFTQSADNDFWLAMKPEMELLASEFQGTLNFVHVNSVNVPDFLHFSEWNRYPVICYFISSTLIKVINGIRGYYGLRHDINEAFGLCIEYETIKVS
jgi:hypothetical protein